MATAAESKRRRYRLEINMRRRVPLGRQMLRILVMVNFWVECTPTDLHDALGMDRRVLYVFCGRLKKMGLIDKEIIIDKGSRTGRSAVYTITDEGKTVARAWNQFLRTIGPDLQQLLRLEG